MFKSVYNSIDIGPVCLQPSNINGDAIAIEVIGEGVYVEDGVVNIPVRLWEQMLNREEQ